MQLKMSSKGEIVIPKKVRDAVGLLPLRAVVLEVKGSAVILHPPRKEGIAKRWAERARRMKLDASKWVMGDELYEEGAYF